jgi:hypothetical protein
MKLFNLLALVSLLTLTGCPKEQPVAKPAAPLGGAQQVSSAITTAATAATAASAADLERLAKRGVTFSRAYSASQRST